MCYFILLDNEPIQSPPNPIDIRYLNSIHGESFPFVNLQEQGFLPWQVSPEGHTLEEHIDFILESFDTQSRPALKQTIIQGLNLSAKIYDSQSRYSTSGQPTEYKPVYHGSNTDLATQPDSSDFQDALKSRYSGHQEVSALVAAKVFIGQCNIDNVDLNNPKIQQEFLTTTFISLIHELGDWYSSIDTLKQTDPSLYQEFSNFCQTSLNIPSNHVDQTITALLSLDTFTTPPLDKHKDGQVQQGTITITKNNIPENPYSEDCLKRIAFSIIAGDWSQCLNDIYLSGSFSPENSRAIYHLALSVLADEIKILRPNAKPNYPKWYDKNGNTIYPNLEIDADFITRTANYQISSAMAFLYYFYQARQIPDPYPSKLAILKSIVYPDQ